MKKDVFGKDEKLGERLKGLGEAFKELFDLGNLWSVENNVLTRTALDNQKKAADYFTEAILGSGKTLGERLEAAAQMFSRKDAFGNVHTIASDKAAVAKALEELKAANAAKTDPDERLHYIVEKGKKGAPDKTKEATTDKEFIKAVNQALKAAKKDGS